MIQIAQEQKYIVLIAPVRRGRTQRSAAEGKAFPLLIQLIYLYLEKIVGGLATSALSYGLTGEATFNVLNISNFGAGASCGLLEVSVGNNGVKTRLGTGGTDVSVGTLLSAISGIKNLGMNEKIKKAAQENNMAQSATALRMLYGFGDDKGLELLDDVLNKKVSLAAGSGPENAQTILENGKRTVYLNGYSNDMTREEQLKLGITLGHEAYRDGVKGSIEKQMAETFSAVAGHTAMIKRVQNDSLYSSVMTGIIESDMNLKNDVTRFDYALKNNDWSSFGEYVLGNYDYSADYWKLVKNTDGQYGWQEDGKLDFYLEDGSKIDADYFDGYLNGTVSITGPENVEAKNKLIQNLKDSGYSKKEIKEFLNGTAGFADASVAARNLMSGKLSQSELDAMNKGLYAAQESGLLVKNKIGTLYDTSLPYVLNDGKDVTWITTQYGFDLLNEKIRNHSAVDLVVNDPKDEKYPTGKTKLVVPETSDITLSYGTDIGLKETFSFGNGSEILYGHMDSNSIKTYLSQFGTEGVSITSNGKLVNVPGGMLTGYIGNTGAKTTGSHLHLEYSENNKLISPYNYFSELQDISVTPYAKVTSGLQGISSTTDKLKLQHIMNYYQFVNNPNKNFNNKYNFSDFYSSYKNSMDSSAFTAATFMYLYKQGKLFQ